MLTNRRSHKKMESNLENYYPNIDQNFEDEQIAEDSKEKESVNLQYYENKLEIVTLTISERSTSQ